jgi:hypothetical protein
MLMTLTYKASGLDVNTQFNAAQSFFFFDGDANRQRLSDYLDAVAAIGLIDPAEIDTLLGEEDDFDKASLLLETTFDQAACERAFSSDGTAARATPPDRHFYEQVGRRALARLVKLADPDAYRRMPLVDDVLWKTMTDTGQPGFKSILPPPITGGDRTREAMRVATIAADYSVIVWWAAAMAEAAARVAEMRAFLNGRTVTASLETDSEFRRLRKRLESSMVKAIGRNRSTFDDPWGLVALYLASAGTAEARAAVVSPKLSLSLPD